MCVYGTHRVILLSNKEGIMDWIEITQTEQLEQIKKGTDNHVAVIFKHSTRCSISNMAKLRLEREPQPAGTSFYLLDLLKYRALSNQIADDFKVHHESPQILIIRNGDCVFEESHNGINMAEIAEQVALN
jgi:bacillithiol system protein YtxJ